jgi:WD and tetratricopeptide repeat-containing protein 1
LPNTENRTIVSGAADYAVRIHDVISGDVIGVCTCHTNRVKRCVTDPLSPSLFWSAGEDGLVIQHDMRVFHNCPSPETSTGRDVLIDLRQFIGSKAEAKCLAINPIKTELFAVGANDPYVRLYDRRIIKKADKSCHWWNEDDPNAVQYFVPGNKHLFIFFIDNSN